ncbi:MAG: GGDEF domain-containing protein [Spirochaetaceae bacterium]|nr:GGDEF domain-containing protein [Spirochaetaceae bacterium]
MNIIINKKVKNVKTVSLVVADINKLKYVNDTFGLIVGDELILKVAKILESLKNLNEVYTGRTGGNEFQIILLNYDIDQSNEILQNIFKKLYSIQLEKADYVASVSFGLVDWNNQDTTEEFIHKTDQLMYANKKRSKPNLI